MHVQILQLFSIVPIGISIASPNGIRAVSARLYSNDNWALDIISY